MKLTKFRNYLDRRLQKGITNCKKLFLEIQQQGFNGSYFSIYRYLKLLKHKNSKVDNRGFHRFETSPGEQAQVDWGSFRTIEINGRIERLYCFVYLLGYSRALYIEFTVKQDLKTFQQCHMHAFDRLGIPKNILYDNVKTVVLKREKLPDGTYKFHYNPDFLDFSRYYGFAIKLCMPYWPRTKGKVESGIKFVRNNFMQGMKFNSGFLSLEELNKKALLWIDNIAGLRTHGTTGERPIDRFAKEKYYLHFPKGLPSYATSPFIVRNSTNDGLIQYKSNFYSVPPKFSRRKLFIKVVSKNGVQFIEIYHEDKMVAAHLISHRRGEWVVDDNHLVNIFSKVKGSTKDTSKKRQSRTPSVFVRSLDYYDRLIQ